MLAGALPRDEQVEVALKGIDWRKLNETYKKYSVVEEIVLKRASEQVPRERVEAFREKVMGELRKVPFTYDESLAKG